MVRRFRSHLSSAHLIAMFAFVFAAAGGTALALPGKNTVNSGDIKNGTVRGVDVRNNSLTGADINESKLAITLPTPPPTAVQTLSQRMAPNSSAAISAGGFTFSSSTDASGQCDPASDKITASEDGRFATHDFDPDGGPQTDNTTLIAAGASVDTIVGASGDFGEIWAMADDGSGGGHFTTYIDTINGHCSVVFTAISA